MIAMRAPAPEPHARHVERGRIATRRRVRHAQRRGYAALVRVLAVAVLAVAPVMLYVMLTANITSLNYKLARIEARKTDLLAETMRQDDQIAKLESRERLAAIAARLGMHDPQTFVIATLPAPQRTAESAHGVALLGAVNAWLSTAAGSTGK